MSDRCTILAVAGLLAAGAACQSTRTSTDAFHLLADGNIDRGRAAFTDLGCHSCHEVAGVDLPRPTVQPPVPVTLGGQVSARLSDAYLVTSILNPSHDLAPYPKAQITTAGQSRMPSYTDRMTVRQLTDVVAFLQVNYSVTRPPEVYR